MSWSARFALLLTCLLLPLSHVPSIGQTQPANGRVSSGPNCGFGNNIGVLSDAEAADARARLNGHLTQFGFPNAGQGQRVIVRWFFDLPARASTADMQGRRAAPVADTARLDKILAFSPDCVVRTAFSTDTRSKQPVTQPFNVEITYQANDNAPVENLGTFFKGAPATIFNRPGIFRLKAIPQGRISPFFLGPITHTVRVDSPAQKRGRGITQLKIDNPGDVPGTAFAIGQKRTADTDAKRHCKSYTFKAIARSGDIISEGPTTIQTRNQREAPYTRALWQLFDGDTLVEQAGPSRQFVFDARKYGNGQFRLFAELSPEDNGPGPSSFQVNATRHIIQVFRCEEKPTGPPVQPRGGAEAPAGEIPDENAPDAGPPPENAVVTKKLDEDNAIVIDEVLLPERFLKPVPQPTVERPDEGTCLECQRELARRERIRRKICGPLQADMAQLIANAPLYNRIQQAVEFTLEQEVLRPLQKIRGAQFDLHVDMEKLLDTARQADVLISAQGQELLQRGLANASKRDKARRARLGNDTLSTGLLIGLDIPEADAPRIFTFFDDVQNLRRDRLKARFVALNTEFNTRRTRVGAAVETFIAGPLQEANQRIGKLAGLLDDLKTRHEEKQNEIKALFASREFEHCLGTPPGQKSVVQSTDNAANFVDADGIPGVNVQLPPHPNRQLDGEAIRKIAEVPSPLDVTYPGLEDFFPIRFKQDGADFLRRQDEIIELVKENDRQQSAARRDDFGRAVVNFLNEANKLFINRVTFDTFFSDDAEKSIEAVGDFTFRAVPQGFDIVLGTDLAGAINENNRVAQEAKFSALNFNKGARQVAGALAQDVQNIGIAIGDGIGVSGVEEGDDVFERARQVEAVRDRIDQAGRGVNTGLVLVAEFAGAGVVTIAGNVIKFGTRTVDSIDELVRLANRRRRANGRPDLSPDQVARLREARKFAENADTVTDAIRIRQRSDRLAKELADRNAAKEIADNVAGGDGLSPDLVDALNRQVAGLGDEVDRVFGDRPDGNATKIDGPDSDTADALPNADEADAPNGDGTPIRDADGDGPDDGDRDRDADNHDNDEGDRDSDENEKADEEQERAKAERERRRQEEKDRQQQARKDAERKRQQAQLEQQRARQQARRARQNAAQKKREADQAIENAQAEVQRAANDANSKKPKIEELQVNAQTNRNVVDNLKRQKAELQEQAQTQKNLLDDDRARLKKQLEDVLNPPKPDNPPEPIDVLSRDIAEVVGPQGNARIEKIREFVDLRLSGKQIPDEALQKLKRDAGLVSENGQTALVFDHPTKPGKVIKIAVDKAPPGRGGAQGRRRANFGRSLENVENRLDGFREAGDGSVGNFGLDDAGKLTVDNNGNPGDLPFVVTDKFPDDAEELIDIVRRASNNGEDIPFDDVVESLRLLHNGAKNGKVFGDLNFGNLVRVPIGENKGIIKLGELANIADIGDPKKAREFAINFQFGGAKIDGPARRVFERQFDPIVKLTIDPDKKFSDLFPEGGGKGFFEVLAPENKTFDFQGEKVDLQELFKDEAAFDDFLRRFDEQKVGELVEENPVVKGLQQRLDQNLRVQNSLDNNIENIEQRIQQNLSRAADLQVSLDEAFGASRQALNDAIAKRQAANEAQGIADQSDAVAKQREQAVLNAEGELDALPEPESPNADSPSSDSFPDAQERQILADDDPLKGDPLFDDDATPVTVEEQVVTKLQQAADDTAERARLAIESDTNLAQTPLDGPEIGTVNDARIEAPIDLDARLRAANPDDAFGAGQTTTAFKVDPADSDSDAFKAFEKLETAEQANIVVQDQIDGARLLNEAGANFLDITGQGTVTFTKEGVRRTNRFLTQKQLPRDARILEDLVTRDADTGAAAAKLPRDQQIAILEQFDKLAKKGLISLDTNDGNIFLQGQGPRSRAGFIETGSVEQVGTSAEAIATARRVQARRLFSDKKTARSALLETVVELSRGGADGKALGNRLSLGQAGKSGQGGAGGLRSLIDPDLQEKFADDEAFARVLQDRDSRLKAAEAGKPVSAETDKLVAKAGALKEFAGTSRRALLEEEVLPSGDIDVANTPTPVLAKVETRRQGFELADAQRKLSRLELEKATSELDGAKASNADPEVIVRLEAKQRDALARFVADTDNAIEAFEAQKGIIANAVPKAGDSLKRAAATAAANSGAGASGRQFDAGTAVKIITVGRVIRVANDNAERRRDRAGNE